LTTTYKIQEKTPTLYIYIQAIGTPRYAFSLAPAKPVRPSAGQ
jgi:hypothetical protein